MGKIKGFLDDELPREKLIKFGPETLTEVELLAIILRTGTKEKNVLELSREILSNFTINQVSQKMYEELLTPEEAERALELDDMYVLTPQINHFNNVNYEYSDAKKVEKEIYSSHQEQLLSKSEIINMLKKAGLL